MNQSNNTTRDGFTLPEVLVAIAVLVVVIFSVTNLVVSIIRTNSENIHTITAYGLAQESLEAVRNIRDSNWLLGANFNGELRGQYDIWGETFPDAQGEQEYYIVRYGVFDRPLDDPSIDQIQTVTPWQLDTVSGPDDEMAKLRRFENSNTGEVRYGHPETVLSTGGDETPYSRYVLIENISPSTEFEMMRVTSVVEWEEVGREKEVRLVTELTDWNQGQL